MVNVQELQHKPISEIIETLKIIDSVTVDLVKLALTLDVSILSRNFEETKIDGEKIICAFVTNKKGRSCIFYSTDLLNDISANRIMIVRSFAKYIITGNDNFYITQSTNFSGREKSLTYEMLMPELQVKEVLDKLILPTTFSLAKIFNVSQEFVRQRLEEMDVDIQIAGYNF